MLNYSKEKLQGGAVLFTFYTPYGDVQVGVLTKEEQIKELDLLLESKDSRPLKETIEDLNKLLMDSISIEDYKIFNSQNLHYSPTTGKYEYKDKNGTFRPISEVLYSDIVSTDNEDLVKAYLKFLEKLADNPLIDEYPTLWESVSSMMANNWVNPYVYEALLEKGLAQEIAERMATTRQFQITSEGNIVLVKAVDVYDKKYVLNEKGEKELVDRFDKTINEDTGEVVYNYPDNITEYLFTPFHRGTPWLDETENKETKFYKVGHTYSLPDKDIDTNPYNTCSSGLHVGQTSYVNDFGSSNSVILQVIIDPKDIRAIPSDYGHAKMRVKRFTVDGVIHTVSPKLSKLVYAQQ